MGKSPASGRVVSVFKGISKSCAANGSLSQAVAFAPENSAEMASIELPDSGGSQGLLRVERVIRAGAAPRPAPRADQPARGAATLLHSRHDISAYYAIDASHGPTRHPVMGDDAPGVVRPVDAHN